MEEREKERRRGIKARWTSGMGWEEIGLYIKQGQSYEKDGGIKDGGLGSVCTRMACDVRERASEWVRVCTYIRSRGVWVRIVAPRVET